MYEDLLLWLLVLLKTTRSHRNKPKPHKKYFQTVLDTADWKWNFYCSRPTQSCTIYLLFKETQFQHNVPCYTFLQMGCQAVTTWSLNIMFDTCVQIINEGIGEHPHNTDAWVTFIGWRSVIFTHTHTHTHSTIHWYSYFGPSSLFWYEHTWSCHIWNQAISLDTVLPTQIGSGSLGS